MAKKKQKVVTEWSEILRDLDLGESFTCTTEQKLVFAPTATRLKKMEGLRFSIKKVNTPGRKACYEITRLEDVEIEISQNI